MFDEVDKVGEIDYLKHKLNALSGGLQPQKTGYWQSLSDTCQKMSADQLKFVTGNSLVKEAESELMNAFNLFLFEKFKEEFANCDSLKPLCDKYLNSFQQANEIYLKKINETFEENKKLKEKIAEMEKEREAKGT